MQAISNYIVTMPEKKDFKLVFVNVVKDQKLVHSGMIDPNGYFDHEMDEILRAALKKVDKINVHTIEHLHATWDYFFDEENIRHIDSKYQPPFSGEYIRYTDDDAEKPANKTKNPSHPWKFMGAEWTVYVHESDAEAAYQAALEHALKEKEAKLSCFKSELFDAVGIGTEDTEKRKKIWDKATRKFGVDTEDQLKKVKEFVEDVAELA